MDDSVRNVRSVSSYGIKTFIAINDFNLDFQDDLIENVYNMNEFYKKVNDFKNVKTF